MIFPSEIQPYAAVIFTAAGIIAASLYELTRFSRLIINNKYFGVLADVVFAILASAVFILTSHFLFDGVIKYFTLLSFFAGGVLGYLVSVVFVRNFIDGKACMYKLKIAEHTKARGERKCQREQLKELKRKEKSDARLKAAKLGKVSARKLTKLPMFHRIGRRTNSL